MMFHLRLINSLYVSRGKVSWQFTKETKIWVLTIFLEEKQACKETQRNPSWIVSSYILLCSATNDFARDLAEYQMHINDSTHQSNIVQWAYCPVLHTLNDLWIFFRELHTHTDWALCVSVVVFWKLSSMLWRKIYKIPLDMINWILVAQPLVTESEN